MVSCVEWVAWGWPVAGGGQAAARGLARTGPDRMLKATLDAGQYGSTYWSTRAGERGRHPRHLRTRDPLDAHGLDQIVQPPSRDRLSRARSIRSCVFSARSLTMSDRLSAVSPWRSPARCARGRPCFPECPGSLQSLGRPRPWDGPRRAPSRPGLAGTPAGTSKTDPSQRSSSCWTWTTSSMRCPSNGGMLSSIMRSAPRPLLRK